jgi:site-specific recombinase XerD
MTSVAQPPRLLDQVRAALRVRRYSRRTEKAYVGWIRRFVIFSGKRHPRQMGKAEITRFLSYLAVRRKVSASTQNQALSALLFLYRVVLGIELDWLDEVVRARRGSQSPRAATRCVTRSPRTCWRPGRTSGPSRSCLVTGT